MDQITFHFDTVLSDVHMHVPSASHLMTRLNHVGQPVFLSRFKILAEPPRCHDSGAGSHEEEDCRGPGGEEVRSEGPETTEGHGGEVEEGGDNAEPSLDEDGDLDVTHRPRRNSADGNRRELVCPVILTQSSSAQGGGDEDEGYSLGNIIRIEHTMATPLEDVGKQVWRGAFLMADFILAETLMFRGATVLELGGGTGFTSVVMATTAKTVYCTDVGEDLLSMCKRNVALNTHLMESAEQKVKVRQLDWLQHDLCTDADLEFSWTEEEVADLHNNTTFIVAADVCYDDDLTDGLFRTLYQLCSHFTHTCTVFISLEKRMNFTLRHMDVSCESYNHFRHCLSQLQELEEGGRCSYTLQQLPTNFAQFFLYERIEHLELWKVTVTPLSVGLDPQCRISST